MPFTSFERCVHYLEEESNLYKRSDSWGSYEPFDRHRIGKTNLNDEYADCYYMYPAPEPINFFMERVTLNGSFEPISVTRGWCDNEFENYVPEIPHPFESGDIVIDVADSPSLPFVYDRYVTWTLKDEKEARKKVVGLEPHLKEKGSETDFALRYHDDAYECKGAIGERCGIMGALYFAHGHMFAYGYEISKDESDGILKYDWTGASDNFLNLEYYKGPFEGKLAILPMVSWFVMNENRPSPPKWNDFLERESKAHERFEDRGIEAPKASSYDICALVNSAYKLG